MATVKLTNVKKVYGKNVVAVQNFNLDIADKEFVVFVGPSGCGKSTTLRMIAGLEAITEGTIEIGGRVVNDMQSKDRNIAMVFQNYALYPHLSVFENMAFALRIKKITEQERDEILARLEAEKAKEEAAKLEAAKGEGDQPDSDEAVMAEAQTPATEDGAVNAVAEDKPVAEGEASATPVGEEFAAAAEKVSAEAEAGAATKKKKKAKYVKIPNDEIYRRVLEAAEILGITEYLTRKPRELSGGQRQRVAIGRAMVRESQVFLMDEPLSNLDAKLRNQMRAEIILLRQKINSTFIYVTHDQTEAMTLGDRIVIMKDGFIMQVGTPKEVFDSPDNLFVAEFIGAPKMNTFRTTLERVGDKYFVSLYGVNLPIDGEKGEALLQKDIQSQDIILGVRPEHITLTNRSDPRAIRCVVEVNEMMGSELHLHVVSETGDKIIVRVPTVSLSFAQVSMLKAGAGVYIAFKSKVMHFFNAESEINLLCDKEGVIGKTPEKEIPEKAEDAKPKKRLFGRKKKAKPAEVSDYSDAALAGKSEE